MRGNLSSSPGPLERVTVFPWISLFHLQVRWELDVFIQMRLNLITIRKLRPMEKLRVYLRVRREHWIAGRQIWFQIPALWPPPPLWPQTRRRSLDIKGLSNTNSATGIQKGGQEIVYAKYPINCLAHRKCSCEIIALVILPHRGEIATLLEI